MKKIFILLLLVATIAACEKEDSKLDTSKYNALIKPLAPNKSSLKAYTADEVVTKAFNMGLDDNRLLCKVWKDTVNHCIVLPYDYVMSIAGDMNYSFMNAQNVTIIGQGSWDVIAYIPNAIMKRGRELVLNAHFAHKPDSVVWYLQNIYKFVPVDDSTYKDLRKKGLN